ncbi:hypothetical protein P3T76_013438 [Phytophthora citrophthora]|uniref:Uncharacterized protein n=1 Tax=Phytophthora citrophthora TaxID=4793 RepID=A0AAD9G3C1_9STRA|nr:hypothetical protein P3T76_013428 [Phytophthora citrophthora]KAK1931249.1 hypothetical protein P3T76_013438 [Phytophthora citrophthora]
MTLTNQVMKLIPHDASPEQIVSCIAYVFALVLLAIIFIISLVFGNFVALVVSSLLLLLGLRWLYRNGVGVLGWTSSWLLNSNVIISSLRSDPQQKGTLRVVCISDTHAKHRNLKNTPTETSCCTVGTSPIEGHTTRSEISMTGWLRYHTSTRS